MIEKRRPAMTLFCLAVLLLAGGLPAWATPADEGAPSPVGSEPKTFGRWPDPVVIDCGLAASLVGKKIAHIRLYALRDGVLGPVPFQIDERDGEGNRVYLSGEHANPEAANGLLDKGEELVFMARDCGDRVPREALPPGVEAYEELELTDPLSGGKGWVYLLYAEADPLPASDADYIEYLPKHVCDPEGDCQVVRSRYMEDRYYPMKPYFDTSKYKNIGFAHRQMSTPPEAGGTGVDYVDRLKGRLVMAFVFGMLKFRADEGSVTFYESAYTDGPIRLVRNIQIIISLPLGLKAPGIAVDLLWYDTIVDVPMVIDLPFNPKYFYTYMELRVGEDHAPGAIGMQVYNSNNLQGVMVDGLTSPEEQATWNNERDEWRLMTGRQGTIMNRSFWDPEYLKQMEWVRVDYIDDLATPDPPEDVPGMIGMIAQTNRVEGIKKARYYSYLEWYWPPSFLFSGPERSYRVGDEGHYLNIADHPVRVRAGHNEMESSYFGNMPVYEKAQEVMDRERQDMEPIGKE